MKRLLLLAALTAFLVSCQSTSSQPQDTEDLKKSAESFVYNWLKSFEIKKWDEPNNLFFENAQLYTPAATMFLKDAFKKLTDHYTNVVSECKVDVISISTEVLGSNAALVTVRYLESDKYKDHLVNMDYLDNYLLGKQDGIIKIKRLITEFSHPVTFSSAVESKWQQGKMEPFNRFAGTLNHNNSMTLYFFEDYKKNGITPDELGKRLGSSLAKNWDQSQGFQGLASGFIWAIQTMSPDIEILERTDKNLKMRYENIFRDDRKKWNITDEEVLGYFKNAFGAIADYMGGNCTIEKDGNFYILTLESR